MRKVFASLCATALVAVAAVPAAGAQTQIGDGLVVVNIAVDDTLNNNNVNVTVPIQAALALAANVCNVTVPVNLAILGAIDAGTQGPLGPADCDARSRALQDSTITIEN